VVRSEDDNHVMLETPVMMPDVYKKQEGAALFDWVVVNVTSVVDTLIVWTDIDGTDLALSFQDLQGCNDIWEHLGDVQKRLLCMGDMHTQGDEDMFRDLEEDMAEDFQIDLPTPDLKNLADIEEKIGIFVRTAVGREKLAHYVANTTFMDELCDLFEMAEDMGMHQEILLIFNIMKTIAMLNDHSVFEKLLDDKLIINICGIFERKPFHHFK
jgi:protein phosphatase-4 regulatory subunit 3